MKKLNRRELIGQLKIHFLQDWFALLFLTMLSALVTAIAYVLEYSKANILLGTTILFVVLCVIQAFILLMWKIKLKNTENKTKKNGLRKDEMV